MRGALGSRPDPRQFLWLCPWHCLYTLQFVNLTFIRAPLGFVAALTNTQGSYFSRRHTTELSTA